jgi:hypothetical protein
MAMLRHVAIYGNDRVFHRLTVAGLDVQGPLVHLVDGNDVPRTHIGDAEEAVI